MKNIFITGASGGIGKACCKAFLQKGCNVAAIYFKNEDSARELAKDATGSKLLLIKADISSETDTINAFEEAVQAFGTIDTVINCAGVSFGGLIQDTTEDTLSRLTDINIKGTFRVCALASKHMVQNRKGSIINISSMWGEVGASCEVAYSMTKAAVIGLTKALAKEVGPSGVRVNCISPGLIDTPMNSCYTKEDLDAIAEETPLCRIGEGEDIAKAALFLAGDESDFITGQILGVNGGYVI